MTVTITYSYAASHPKHVNNDAMFSALFAWTAKQTTHVLIGGDFSATPLDSHVCE